MWTNYIHWLHGLPMWGQVIVTAFLWSFFAWLPLAIWEQRHFPDSAGGSRPRLWHGLLLFIPLFYLRDKKAWAWAAMDWPDHHIPHWHEYWFCIIPAVLLSGMIAKQIAIACVGRSKASGSAALSHGGFISIIRRIVRVEEE